MNQILPLATNAVAESAAAAPAALTGENTGDFSRVFSEAMAQSLAGQSLSGLSGQGFTMPGGQGLGDIQSALMAQAVNGQADDQQLMMFMMMMMMQEFGDSDLAPMMGTLFSALSGASGSKGNIIPAGSLKTGVTALKSAAAGFLPTQAWLPTALRVTSSVATRSASLLRNVIDQFNVESAERYRPHRNDKTYCNIFLWDVTRALGCEIPHYVDRASGEPRSWPDTKDAYELDANGTHDWLVKYGADYGWQEVSAEQAQSYANAGYPAVTAWKSTGGTAGHVQVVCPSANGGFDAKRGVTVAQAGGRNFSYAHINTTMSRDKLPNVRYFIHT